MEFGTFAYAWDLLDEGVEAAADTLTEIGITEVNVATNYHSTQTYNPRNPERSTFFTHASSYFQPDSAHYGELEPVPNETMGEDDWLAEIDAAIAETPLTLNSWTIGCHNSRLGMANPEYAIENPYGDELVFGLCPSKPPVQAYLTGLLADLSARADFGRIELETFDYFWGTGFGWHHDKFHAELGPLGKFLFGLCFCEDCTERAARAGADVETAREQATRTIDLLTEGELSPDVSEVGWFRTHPELYDYARVREDTLTDLYADLADAVDGPDLGRYLANGPPPEDAWKQGVDIDAVSAHVDYYLPLAYGATPEQSVDVARSVMALTDTPVHAAVMPAHPLITDAASLRAVVDGLYEAGVERVSFYNYGLLAKRNLDWIASATEPYV